MGRLGVSNVSDVRLYDTTTGEEICKIDTTAVSSIEFEKEDLTEYRRIGMGTTGLSGTLVLKQPLYTNYLLARVYGEDDIAHEVLRLEKIRNKTRKNRTKRKIGKRIAGLMSLAMDKHMKR